jgi:hypothetical protein
MDISRIIREQVDILSRTLESRLDISRITKRQVCCLDPVSQEWRIARKQEYCLNP